MSFYKKLALVLSLIIVIPLLSVTFFAYRNYSSIMDHYVSETEMNDFDNLYETVRSSYDSLTVAMGSLSFYSNDRDSLLYSLRELNRKGTDIQPYDLYDATDRIMTAGQSMMYRNSYIKGIYVFSGNGYLFSHTREWITGMDPNYDPSSDEWYQKTLALNGSLYLGPVGDYPMFTQNQHCCIAAQVIRDADSFLRPVGVILLQCDPSFWDPMRELSVENIVGLSLTDRTYDTTLLKWGDDGTEENARIRRLAKEVESTPVTLTLRFDDSALRNRYSAILYMLLALSLFFMIVSVYLCTRLLHWTLSPITVLSNHMSRKGLPEPIEDNYMVNNSTEIGVLYREYNHMVEALNRSIQNEYQNRLIMLDAQMQSMEATINSHFLFNTLESINSMAEIDDNEEISIMSLALGNMFRYAIKTKGEIVSLRQELQNAYDYNSIQQIRFSHKYRLIVDIPDELMETRVLKLILQPLVENALVHGLDHCACGSVIRISARAEAGLLTIRVSDDGCGIVPDKVKELREHILQPVAFTNLGHREGKSIGLKNIQSRIELYYGKGYGLNIESAEAGNTSITVTIPILTEGGNH